MEHSAELVQFVHDWFAAASRGDGSILRTRVSTSADTSLIGSDPSEDLRGGQAVIDFLQGEVDGAAGNVSFTPADVVAYEDGALGWATARLTITIPDGGQVKPRWSAVFTREAGRWQLVHLHASIGVTNEQVGWVYPDSS